jgi:flagellum-specific peptidoglycan hydrolase FlgJ
MKMKNIIETNKLELLLLVLVAIIFSTQPIIKDKLLYKYACQINDTTKIEAVYYDTLNQPLPMHVNKFLLENVTIAQKMEGRTGFPASLALAQGMLESNFGRSELSKRAHNYHGIIYCNRADRPINLTDGFSKKSIKWSGWRTRERGWKNYFEMMSDPKWIFKSKWHKHTDKRNYFDKMARGIAGAYAEDPAYADKLIELNLKYNLTRFDR